MPCIHVARAGRVLCVCKYVPTSSLGPNLSPAQRIAFSRCTFLSHSPVCTVHPCPAPCPQAARPDPEQFRKLRALYSDNEHDQAGDESLGVIAEGEADALEEAAGGATGGAPADKSGKGASAKAPAVSVAAGAGKKGAAAGKGAVPAATDSKVGS